ncbi:MAG TPA: hypothetical protein VGE74_25745, partial [Gemmata sp.]
SSDGTYEDTSASLGTISLPGAGTYFIYGLIGAEAYGTLPSNPLTNSFIYVDVYDATAGQAVPGSGFVVLSLAQTNKNQMSYGSFTAVYTVTGPSTLYWRGGRHTPAGSSWTVSLVGSVGPGRPTLGYFGFGPGPYDLLPGDGLPGGTY